MLNRTDKVQPQIINTTSWVQHVKVIVRSYIIYNFNVTGITIKISVQRTSQWACVLPWYRETSLWSDVLSDMAHSYPLFRRLSDTKTRSSIEPEEPWYQVQLWTTWHRFKLKNTSVILKLNHQPQLSHVSKLMVLIIIKILISSYQTVWRWQTAPAVTIAKQNTSLTHTYSMPGRSRSLR